MLLCATHNRTAWCIMAKMKYHSGDRFNLWTLVEHVGGPSWKAKCDCGAEKTVFVNHITTGKSKSCRACSSIRRTTHGLTGSPEYKTWGDMRQRCLHPLNARYHQYGGRGIKICESWGEFSNFLADMGPRPEGASLDRIDVDGPYSPDNCRWATAREQARNRRIHKGSELGIAITEAAETVGLPYSTLQTRLKRGWSTDKALSEPIRDSTKTVRGQARKLGLPPDTIATRVRRGWSIEKALSTPVQHRCG